MNPEDIGKILDEIGERIGPAGAYAWEITVRQVVIDASVWLSLGALALVVALGAFTYAAVRRSADALGVGLLALTGLIPMGVALTQLLNPEYHAMVRLLERLVP